MQHNIPVCAVYILSNPGRSIYMGAAQDLERRIFEHKTKPFADSHSAKYNIDRLVWWQQCEDWSETNALELQLKNLHKAQKVAIVNESNPRRLDLSCGLFHWSSSRFKQKANK